MYDKEHGYYHSNERPTAKVYKPYRYRVSDAIDIAVTPRLFRALRPAKNFAKELKNPEIYDMKEQRIANLDQQYYAK